MLLWACVVCSKVEARRLRRDVAKPRQFSGRTGAAVDEGDQNGRARRFADELRDAGDVQRQLHAAMVAHSRPKTLRFASKRTTGSG